MTAATDLVAEAHGVGITIRRRGDHLSLVAPTAPPPELLERIRQSKAELIAALPDEAGRPTNPASDARALLTEAHAVGLRLIRRGDRLTVRPGATPPPAALVERLRKAKAALLLALPDEAAPPANPDLRALALSAAQAAGMPTSAAYLESVVARALLFAPDPNHKLGD